jgi:DNA-binding beta-propeller fold protein YncE
LDIRTARVARTIDLSAYPRPHGIAYLPGDSVVAVTSEAGGSVVLVRVSDGTVVKAIPTGQRGSHMLGVVGDGSTIYTGNIQDGTVARLDVASGERTGLFPVPPDPEAINVSSDGTRVWVGSNSQGLVSVLDPRTGVVQSPLSGFGWPYRVLPVPSRGMIVLPDFRRSEVRFVSLPDHVELGRLSFPEGGAQGVIATPDARWLFIALSLQDRVVIVDLETREVAGSIPTGASPDGVAWSPVTGN